MNFEIYFNFVFTLVVIYVLFGNYLYFRKIIPALDTAPSLNPSTQLNHVKLYIKMLQEKGENPWFLPFLKYIKLVTLFILLLMIPGFLKVFELI